MIQLAQGKAPFLPKPLGVVGGFRGDIHIHRAFRHRWLHLLTLHPGGQVVVTQPALRCQGRLAAAASCGDALSPFGIGHIAGRENAFHGRFRSSGLRCQVTLVVQIDLPLKQIGVGGVADGIEEPLNGDGG